MASFDNAPAQRPLASLENPDIERDQPLPFAAPENPRYASSFDEFAGMFPQPESVFFADRGEDYRDYKTAFDFGVRLARDPGFAEKSWLTAEAGVRAQWESSDRPPWEDACQALRAGWEDARGSG